MAGKTNIAWTEESWNPTRGCERVSPGCKQCYAEVMAARHSYPGGWGEHLAKWVIRPDGSKEARWAGVMQMMPALLDWPLRRRKPSRIFVNSTSDLFHKDVPFEFIAAVFGVMALCQEHTFQILTKRADRMLDFFCWAGIQQGGAAETCAWQARKQVPLVASRERFEPAEWPLENVWLGVSVEQQAEADERIPLLLEAPAAVRWISAEPLLGPVSIDAWSRSLGWVVIGGESGQGHRPMDMSHARALGHQCVAAGIPVFVKQDSGPRPGMQGRFTAEEWALKEFPS